MTARTADGQDPTAPAVPAKVHFPALDGYRALAALICGAYRCSRLRTAASMAAAISASMITTVTGRENAFPRGMGVC